MRLGISLYSVLMSGYNYKIKFPWLIHSENLLLITNQTERIPLKKLCDSSLNIQNADFWTRAMKVSICTPSSFRLPLSLNGTVPKAPTTTGTTFVLTTHILWISLTRSPLFNRLILFCSYTTISWDSMILPLLSHLSTITKSGLLAWISQSVRTLKSHRNL